EDRRSMSSPGTNVSMGRVLLVSTESGAIQMVTGGTQQLAIMTEVCPDVSLAFRLLDGKKFEAVIVDFGLSQADQMLERVRLSEINRTAVTFAMTDPLQPPGFEIQPNFVIEKPLSANLFGRTLKAAFGLMVRERRRYFRCPTAIPAVVHTNGKEFSCHLVNLSKRGMAVTELPSLKPGTQLRVLFTLPGQG